MMYAIRVTSRNPDGHPEFIGPMSRDATIVMGWALSAAGRDWEIGEITPLEDVPNVLPGLFDRQS